MIRKASWLAVACAVAACGGNPETGPQGDKGANGAPGATSLVRLDVELEGEHCAQGGAALHSGVDGNGDGELSDEEVTATRYVCHGSGEKGEPGNPGSNGAKALVRLENEPAGGNCEFGGTAVRAGLDVDGDDELSEEEVTSTAYVCDGFGEGDSAVWEGDYRLDSPAAALALRGIRHITGALRVYDLADMEVLSLTNLQHIDGELEIHDTGLVRVSLPRLETVGRGVELLPPQSPPVPQEVFKVSHNAALVSFSAPLLESVGGTFGIYTNDALSSFELPTLRDVGEYFWVFENPSLPQCLVDALLAALEDRHSGTCIYGNDEAATCEE